MQASLPQSTLVEQVLLFSAIVMLPLQDHIPAVAGMSIMFLIFAALGMYVVFNRSRTLGKIWYHPVFIAAYAFIGVSVLLEVSSPLSGYTEITRFGQMIAGAICVATICRDRAVLAAGLYGYIAAGMWIAAFLYSSSYGTLQEMAANDLSEADQLRAQTFGDTALRANINGMAFVCAQGAIVAFALSLLDRLQPRRFLLLGVSVFCLVAAFLPMSRGTVVVILVSFGMILYAHGAKHVKTLMVISLLGVCVYMLVPDAVWSRMAFSTGSQGGAMDSRAKLYTTAFDRLPEYIGTGVGAGNFWKKWGFEKGFQSMTQEGIPYVKGVHNSLLQITIFWGALGLFTFMWIIWLVYRATPLECGRDGLSLALLGIIVSLGPLLLQQQNYYEKVFAIGLGLLLGARQWIWPTGIVSAASEVDRYPSGVDMNIRRTATLGSSKG